MVLVRFINKPCLCFLFPLTTYQFPNPKNKIFVQSVLFTSLSFILIAFALSALKLWNHQAKKKIINVFLRLKTCNEQHHSPECKWQQVIMGEQNSDICFLWYWPGVSTQKVSPVAIALMSFTSLFLLFIMWWPIFNNEYNLANVRCCGNALYFFAMAIFSSRAPLFISGFKKSVWIINEQGVSLERAFEWRFSTVGWKFHGNIRFNLGVFTQSAGL